MIASLRQELRRHPWMAPGVLLSGAAAFGSALPDIIAFAHRVLS